MLIGKKRRLTIIECGNDMNTMIDVAKVADLVRKDSELYGKHNIITGFTRYYSWWMPVLVLRWKHLNS